MLDILSANPWLVAVGEIALVPLVGVVVGIVCVSFNVCRRKIRVAQFDFELKRDMLRRGMSAEEIRTVIEAGRRATHPPEDCRALVTRSAGSGARVGSEGVPPPAPAPSRLHR